MQSLWWGLGCLGRWGDTAAWGGSRGGGALHAVGLSKRWHAWGGSWHRVCETWLGLCVAALLLGTELARTGHVCVLVAVVSFCCETWEAKHAWLLNIVRGEHFDMWDIVVSRQHWTFAFLTFPMQAKPKVNLSPRWCKYNRAGCGGGRLCNCRSNCLSLGLQLGCC